MDYGGQTAPATLPESSGIRTRLHHVVGELTAITIKLGHVMAGLEAPRPREVDGIMLSDKPEPIQPVQTSVLRLETLVSQAQKQLDEIMGFIG